MMLWHLFSLGLGRSRSAQALFPHAGELRSLLAMEIVPQRSSKIRGSACLLVKLFMGYLASLTIGYL